jgi:hypothetical protein
MSAAEAILQNALQLSSNERADLLEKLRASFGVKSARVTNKSNQQASRAASAERGPLLGLLDSWLEEDAEEQPAEGAALLKALDENRLSDRPLFPAELEGSTW